MEQQRIPSGRVETNSAYMRDFSGGALLSAATTVYSICMGLICILYGFLLERSNLHVAGIVVFSVLALMAWLAAVKRYRAIADTPTATLRSAAQGYVEVTGICRAIPGVELLRPHKAPACVWYFAKSKTKKGGTEYGFARSYEKFLIEDGTGECVIDPQQAEVLLARQKTWEDEDAIYEIRYLLPGDRLYAIGDMCTLRAADGSLMRSTDLGAGLRREWMQGRRSAEVSALLREWKRDRTTLVKQYDIDGDGDIDQQEWQGTVAAAEREVASQHRDVLRNPGLHIMSAPADGRPFLLSNRHPDELRHRYNLWAWFYLAVFIATSVWGLSALVEA